MQAEHLSWEAGFVRYETPGTPHRTFAVAVSIPADAPYSQGDDGMAYPDELAFCQELVKAVQTADPSYSLEAGPELLRTCTLPLDLGR